MFFFFFFHDTACFMMKETQCWRHCSAKPGPDLNAWLGKIVLIDIVLTLYSGVNSFTVFQ